MTYDMPTLDSVLCLREAMENLGGDAELLQEILEIFVETGGEQLQSISDGLAVGDMGQVALQAHAMKGGASNFCARDFVATALALETLAKSGTLDGADVLLARLREQFLQVGEVSKVINWDEVARAWGD